MLYFKNWILNKIKSNNSENLFQKLFFIQLKLNKDDDERG